MCSLFSRNARVDLPRGRGRTRSGRGLIFKAGLFAGLLSGVISGTDSEAEQSSHTTLAINSRQFTVNGKPQFLLGFSYYAALGAPEDFIRKDLGDFQKLGFNWLRVWVNWSSFGKNISALDDAGRAREPFFEKLKWLVAECDRRGLIVDLTLTRGGGRLPDLATHRCAVETLVTALNEHRNWYLDLANERDVRDDRYVPITMVKTLREEVHRLDPQRLVTASLGGHDLSAEDVRDCLVTAGLDFLCPHRPRTPESPSETAVRTRACLERMKELARPVPILHQEPFRRGYTAWEPAVADFLTDLRGAVEGGAAGWCFHNGQQADTAEHQPRRSFDLSAKRLFDQLDPVEREVVAKAASIVKAAKDH